MKRLFKVNIFSRKEQKKTFRPLILIATLFIILLTPNFSNFGFSLPDQTSIGACSINVQKNGTFFLLIEDSDLNKNQNQVNSFTVEFPANSATTARKLSNQNNTLEVKVNNSTFTMGNLPFFVNLTETGIDTGIFNATGLDMSLINRSLQNGLKPNDIVTFVYTNFSDGTTNDCDIKIKKTSVVIALNPINNVVSGTSFTVSGALLDADNGSPISNETIAFDAPGLSNLTSVETRGFVFQDPSNMQLTACNTTKPSNPEGGDGELGTTDDLYSDCIPDNDYDLDRINNVLHLHEGAKIFPPKGTKGVMLHLQDMGNNNVHIIVKDNDPTTIDFEQQIMGVKPDALTYTLAAPNHNDIVEIRVTAIDVQNSASPTLGLSNIESFDPAGDPQVLLVADFEDLVTFSSQQKIEVGGGSFFSVGLTGSHDGVYTVKAKFVENDLYLSAESIATFSTITPTWNGGGGGGGGYNEIADTWPGFSAINCSADSDGDSLCNSWENTGPTGGIPYSDSGTKYYKLCADFGGSGGDCPDNTTRDIYVEIDYMPGHRPADQAITEVKQAFSDMGYDLHIFIDDTDPLPLVSSINVWADPGGSSNGNNNDDFYRIKQTRFGNSTEQKLISTGFETELVSNPRLKAKAEAFHYVLFVNQIGTCGPSGVAEKPGNDLVVGLYTDTSCSSHFDNTWEEQAGTLMHELGHNFNLDHGGPIDIRNPAGVLSGTQGQVPTDAGPGDTSRGYKITQYPIGSTRLWINYPSATTGELFLTTTVQFVDGGGTGGADPGTTSVSSVTYSPTSGSLVSIDTTKIKKIVSSPSPGSTQRQVQLKIPFTTTGATTDSTTGAIGDITVSLTIANSNSKMQSTTTSYSPNIRIDVPSLDYSMNCKANYPSVMSYSTQFPYYYYHANPSQPWPLNYSNETLPNIDETLVNEANGLQSTSNPRPIVFGVPLVYPLKDYGWGMTYKSSQTGIDWKGDGGTSWSGAENLNDLHIRGCGLDDSGATATTPNEMQKGFNDWDNLQLDFRRETSMIDGIYPDPIKSAELTAVEYQIIKNATTPVPHFDWLLVIILIIITAVTAIIAALIYYRIDWPHWIVAVLILVAIIAAGLVIYIYFTYLHQIGVI